MIISENPFSQLWPESAVSRCTNMPLQKSVKEQGKSLPSFPFILNEGTMQLIVLEKHIN